MQVANEQLKNGRGGTRIAVGRIVRPHGIRGEVKVVPLRITPERFFEFGTLAIKSVPNRIEWFKVERVRIQNQRIILKLSGIDNRDQAESLRNTFLKLPEEDCEGFRENVSNSIELIGFKAKTVEGMLIGTVVEILQKSIQNVLVVESEGKEIMIPDVSVFVKTVDRTSRVIIIDPIEGLLD